MDSETKIFALRKHYKGETEDFIAVQTTDEVFYVMLKKEKVEEALHQFETGEEVNINY